MTTRTLAIRPTLRAKLAVVPEHYNSLRLHQALNRL